MSLTRKIIFVCFVAIALVLAVIAYNSLRQNKKPKTDVLTQIPANCVLYASSNNFHELRIKLNSQSLILKQFLVFDYVKHFSESINYYDSIVQNSSFLNSLLDNNLLHFAVYKGNAGVNWLAAFNLKELKQEEEIKSYLKDNFETISDDVFKLKNSVAIRVDGGGVFICNSEQFLTEIEKSKEKLIGTAKFKKLNENNNQNELIKIFVDHDGLKNNGSLGAKWSDLIKASTSLSSLKIGPGEIVVNGNYIPDSSLLQSVVVEQEPGKIDFYDLLPYNTTEFKAIAISDPEKFKNTISLQLKQDKNSVDFVKELNEIALYNIHNEILTNISSNICAFKTLGSDHLMISVNDTLKGRENLKFLSDSSFANGEMSVYHLKNKNALKYCLCNLFENEYSYAFKFENALYFSSTLQSSQELLFLLKSKSVLSSNLSFINYSNSNIGSEYSYIHYLKPVFSLSSFNDLFPFDLEKNKGALANLSDANIHIIKAGDRIKFRMQLNYQSPQIKGMPELLWQCQLDSAALCQPYIFINHNTKENEITIQDGLKQLYLINSTGGIIWKKKINEEIRSKIYTVDLFKNNKFQMLFNTDNYLHLIDRNGNYVQGYPIKLPAQASNEISLLDYDGDKDYRILIACKNNLVYNFNLYGVKTEGYKPYRTPANIKLPVKYVKVGLSDYLVTIDIAGNIHTFSRKGDARVGLKNKAVENCSDFDVQATNNINSTYLLYVDDKNSLIEKISFADKKEVVKIDEPMADAQIIFDHMNDDKIIDFCALSPNGLQTYDINGNVLYLNKSIKGFQKPVFYRADFKQIYFSLNKSEGKLFKTDNESTSFTEFNSTTLPAAVKLFNDGTSYMIYANGNKIFCNPIK